VGHSFGGQTIREFARQYAKDVAGIVIAEGVSENQRIQMGPKNTGLIADAAAHKTIPPPHSKPIGADRPNLPKLPDGIPPLEPPFDKLPAREQQLHVWAISQPALYAAEESERQWSAEYFARWREHPESARLGDIPLVVLTRADGGYGDDLDVPAAQLEQNRRESQASLAKLSKRGKQVIVKSGHNLQMEAPWVVVETIRSLVDEIRSTQPN
jgi:pimeloyl-ACP methyl ester carboxylesterase